MNRRDSRSQKSECFYPPMSSTISHTFTNRDDRRSEPVGTATKKYTPDSN